MTPFKSCVIIIPLKYILTCGWICVRNGTHLSGGGGLKVGGITEIPPTVQGTYLDIRPGSIRYDEHRIRLKAKLGHDPTFKQLFYQTHLTMASKVKYWDGDDADLQFCTAKAKNVYEAYERAMLRKYGEDETQHVGDDVDLWVESQAQGRKKARCVFGTGCGDINFVVIGKPSSESSSSEYLRSQEEVQETRTQIDVLQREKEDMQRRQTLLEEQMTEIIRQFRSNSSNPPNLDNPPNDY